MAIDTAVKRSAALDHEEVWSSGMPMPGAAVSQRDRWHLLFSYPMLPASMTIGWTLRSRSIGWTFAIRSCKWTVQQRDVAWTLEDR